MSTMKELLHLRDTAAFIIAERLDEIEHLYQRIEKLTDELKLAREILSREMP